MNTERFLRYALMVDHEKYKILNPKWDQANEIIMIFSKHIYDELVEWMFKYYGDDQF